MKRKFLFVVVAGLLLGADAPQDDTVKDVEKALATLNEAFQKQNTEAVKKLLTDDHVAVTAYYGGPLNRTEQLASMTDLKLTEYTAGKTKVTVLGKDTVLITYDLTLKGTYKGKTVPPKGFASAVWVKRDGKWLEAFYQETPLGGQ